MATLMVGYWSHYAHIKVCLALDAMLVDGGSGAVEVFLKRLVQSMFSAAESLLYFRLIFVSCALFLMTEGLPPKR